MKPIDQSLTFVIGQLDGEEFSDVLSQLRQYSEVISFRTIEEAIAGLTEQAYLPQLIVIAQSFPSKFTSAQIERFITVSPLSRIVGIMGSWSEGELRSGRPWPTASRMYWHQYRARMEQDWKKVERGECPSWGLPLTMPEDERILFRMQEAFEPRQGLVAIHADSWGQGDWLAEACRLRGYSTVQLLKPEALRISGVTAVIVEAGIYGDATRVKLGKLRAQFPRLPLVLLSSFLRDDQIHHARMAGATAILCKPCRIEDLFWCLDHPAEECERDRCESLENRGRRD